MQALDFTDLIGRPFKYGARGPMEFDCYGLLIEVQRRIGNHISDYPSSEQGPENASAIVLGLAEEWEPTARPEVGCGVVFRVACSAETSASHVGAVISDDVFLHTMERTGGVVAERLSHPAWAKRITGFYRWKGKS